MSDLSALLEQARRGVARSVNAILTATYWEIGRRIVEHEQAGQARAGYGEEVLARLSRDLVARFGRGFSARNLRQMRAFYFGWEIWQTPSAKLEARAKCPELAGESPVGPIVQTHRGLRCLVVIDLKTGAFTHADAGQMNLYLNYARGHLMMTGENDPVGIILCSDKDDAVVKYATGGILAQVFASKYLTSLPDEETLRREIVTTRRAIGSRVRNEKPA